MLAILTLAVLLLKLHAYNNHAKIPIVTGGMPEWSNGAVLKTAVPARVPGVRIPLPPLNFVPMQKDIN